MVALSFLRNRHTVFRSGFPPIYTPTNSIGGRFPFLHALSSIYCLQTFWWWPFWPVWYITVVLICMYLIISDVGHLFMCLLATCISSLEKYLFRSFAHFLIEFFRFFGYLVVWSVCMFWKLSPCWHDIPSDTQRDLCGLNHPEPSPHLTEVRNSGWWMTGELGNSIRAGSHFKDSGEGTELLSGCEQNFACILKC